MNQQTRVKITPYVRLLAEPALIECEGKENKARVWSAVSAAIEVEPARPSFLPKEVGTDGQTGRDGTELRTLSPLSPTVMNRRPRSYAIPFQARLTPHMCTGYSMVTNSHTYTSECFKPPLTTTHVWPCMEHVEHVYIITVD